MIVRVSRPSRTIACVPSDTNHVEPAPPGPIQSITSLAVLVPETRHPVTTSDPVVNSRVPAAVATDGAPPFLASIPDRTGWDDGPSVFDPCS